MLKRHTLPENKQIKLAKMILLLSEGKSLSGAEKIALKQIAKSK